MSKFGILSIEISTRLGMSNQPSVTPWAIPNARHFVREDRFEFECRPEIIATDE